MANSQLSNPLLHRYWFQTKFGFGYGVTAFSLEDARNLLAEVVGPIEEALEIVNVLEDVDVRNLDQNHVVPNMGLPNLRGVWYPRLNV